METILQLGLLAVGLVLLVKGADWFVDGTSGMATRFGIPQLVIGLTIVAMGTSAPEAAVSITSAMKGSADITIGNIVGSNILNILIILGISALITPLAVARSTIRVETPFMMAITLLLLALGYNGMITLLEGMILLLAFALYLGYLFKMAKAAPDEAGTKEEQQLQEKSWGRFILLAAAGLVLIIAGSNIAVDAAAALARILGLSERFIGLTIVALGTSLPELFTSVSAARKGNADIAIGNIVGSNIFNILFVVGLSALIVPVPFARPFVFDTLVALLAAVLLFLCCFKTHALRRWAGGIMLIAYGAYFLVIF